MAFWNTGRSDFFCLDMNNVLNASDREELLARISRLNAEVMPRWGRMTAEQMVCHPRDPVAVALGERPAA